VFFILLLLSNATKKYAIMQNTSVAIDVLLPERNKKSVLNKKVNTLRKRSFLDRIARTAKTIRTTTFQT